MRYTQPKITGTFAAMSLIKSEKGSNQFEVNLIAMTNGPAYQSEE
jgi:hypothetical protein